MTRWLESEQQRYWRAWLSASALLRDELSHELQAAHGHTLVEYEILVRLSEAPEGRLRMGVLAEHTFASRSRLTHQVDRLERAGLVTREKCADDRRGQLAILTERGRDKLVEMAPTHVEGVRRHLVDALTPQQFTALGEACERVAAGLRAGT